MSRVADDSAVGSVEAVHSVAEAGSRPIVHEKDRYSSGTRSLRRPRPGISGYYVTRIEDGLHLSHSQREAREPVHRAFIRPDGMH